MTDKIYPPPWARRPSPHRHRAIVLRRQTREIEDGLEMTDTCKCGAQRISRVNNIRLIRSSWSKT